ncbi:MAG: ParB/RepB/Spo0J family partition protein [Chloroflexi bacterium]|nr:ParB/RepB/Spo0J family partition protein [Chloroflexota bacterium]
MDIAIDLIKPSPYQPRLDFDLEDLRGSIMKDGIASPIVVRQIDTGYELIDGERRVKLAKELGYKTVPCQVIEADNERAMRLVWRLNVERKDYTPKEKAHHFRTCREREGMSLREIGRLFGYDHHGILMYLNVFKLPEEYQEAVWQGSIPIGNIRELEALLGSGEYAPQEVIDWLDQRLSQPELQKALKPTLAKYKEKQIEKAQEAVGEIAPEITLETPEDYEKAAQALKEEAKRRAEEVMTPEEKAAQEAEKRAKTEAQAAIRAQREEERKQQREEERRRLEERAMRKARAELAKDPDFIRQVIKEQQLSLDISVPRQAREEMPVVEGTVYTIGRIECDKCGKTYTIKCDGKRNWLE